MKCTEDTVPSLEKKRKGSETVGWIKDTLKKAFLKKGMVYAEFNISCHVTFSRKSVFVINGLGLFKIPCKLSCPITGIKSSPFFLICVGCNLLISVTMHVTACAALLQTLQLNSDLLKGISMAMKTSFNINGILQVGSIIVEDDVKKEIREFEKKLQPHHF